MRTGKTIITFAAIGAVLLYIAVWRAARVRAQTDVVPATFTFQGPAGISGSDYSPLAGAVNAIVPDPTNASVAWIGSVNGGVWKTTNFTSASPTWVPLTDHMPSLSISSLALDPTTGNQQVLVAGIGGFSSLFGTSGPLTGILRTTDGGTSWTALGSNDLSGEKLIGVAARGNVIVVASKTGKTFGTHTVPGGIWRSTDTGASFQLVTGTGVGLPQGAALELAGDPSNTHRLYAGIAGPNGDLFRSDDDGQTWTRLNGAPSSLVKNSDNIEISVHVGAINAVYAAIDANSQLAGLFRSTDLGQTWSALDVPNLHPGTQGSTDLSTVADPTNANLVYLGGDHEPAGEGGGQLFRCNASLPAGSQCARIVREGTVNDTATHPDSRDMEFDALGRLLETDDGGVFLLSDPRNSTSDWVNKNGNLGITETHTCAYDHVFGIILCGTQDNGSPEQSAPGALVWDSVGPYDGSIVSIVDEVHNSTRYFSSHGLDSFTKMSCNDVTGCVTTHPQLKIGGNKLNSTFDPSVSIYTPMSADGLAPNRVVIATNTVYESNDGADTFTTLSGFTGTATRAIAYGGRKNGAGNPDVLYVGNSNGLFLRSSGGGSLGQLTAYTGAQPREISLDPDDWYSAWVVTGNKVWHTTDAGASWTDVTGNLTDMADDLHTVVFIPGVTTEIIAVGASDGVYVSNVQQVGHWAKLSGSLPNAVAYHLDYDSTDDILLVATLGRGTWTMSHVSHLDLPPVLNLGPDGNANEGSAFIQAASYTDLDHAADENVTGTVNYGDGSGSQSLALLPNGSFTLNHVYADNGVYEVSVSVTDGHGAISSSAIKVTVANVPPSVGPINVAAIPAGPGTNVTLAGVFTDPGVLDTHTGTIRWGDGTGPMPATLGGSNTMGTISGLHVTTINGRFTVRVTIDDKDGGTGFTTVEGHTPITVDVTNAFGAVVTFPLPDPADPSGSCAPASGSTFPMGTTNVICKSTDAELHVNTATFPVTVRTPLETKRNVLGQLIALRATVTDQQDGKKLDDAINQLRQSVDPNLWANSSHPNEKDVETVFNDEKDTVHKLLDLIKNKHSTIPDANLQAFIDRITQADRVLALVAINDAISRGGDSKEIDGANKELAKGEEQLANGKPEDAIEHYKNAWKQAVKA